MSRETKIGIAVFILLLFIGTAGLFLEPFHWLHRDTYEVHAVFDNAQGIREKAQVLYAGVYVGNVRRIRVKDGKAILDLDIKEKTVIPEDARFTIDSSGVVGDLYVKISGGRPGSRILSDGMTVQEYRNDRMDELMNKAGKLMDTAKSVQENIEGLRDGGK
ncbi:MlaD family protein [Dialister sp.]|uniref:MlaD family protein n=1 Tax=Dialister sp. TaxID=1955814 RepID=UPI003F066CC1